MKTPEDKIFARYKCARLQSTHVLKWVAPASMLVNAIAGILGARVNEHNVRK